MNDDPNVPTSDIDEAWRRLDPVKPLPSESPWYVDCGQERGIHHFVERIVKDITRSATGSGGPAWVHHLVVGHRGSGKSTELLRLQARLRTAGFYPLYVDLAEEREPDQLDCEAIITIVLRRLVTDLGSEGIELDPDLLGQVAEWFGKRVTTATASRSSQVGAEVEAGLRSSMPIINLLAKFAGYIRWGTAAEDKLTIEYRRYLGELREQISPLLIDAGQKLSSRAATPNGLVILADSLDHIRDADRQDEVFLESAEILTGLSASVVYTAPAALLAAGKGPELDGLYGACHRLPVVKTRDVSGQPFAPGLDRMREIIARRCDLSLFEEDALARVCAFSGGHPRHLVRLAQTAISAAISSPVTLDSVNRAVSDLSYMLTAGCGEEHWKALAAVDKSPLLTPSSDEGRELLYWDCVLTHENAAELDEDEIPSQWYAVHPAVRRVQGFKEAAQA